MKICEVVFDIPVRKSFSYLIPGDADFLTGQRVLAPFGRQKKTGWIVGTGEFKPDVSYKEILKLYDSPPIPEQTLNICRWIADSRFVPPGRIISRIAGSLTARIPEEQQTAEKSSGSYHPSGSYPVINRILNPEEKNNRILLEFSRACDKLPLYLELAGSLKQGSSVFIFSAANDAEAAFVKFRENFPDRVVLFTGRQGKEEKTRAWIRMQREKNLIVTGTRMAVFSPLYDLKLMLVDEPEDFTTTDKNTGYSLRDAAFYTAEKEKAALLLCTTQPDIFEINLIRKNGIKHLEVNGGTVPETIILRMQKPFAAEPLQEASRHLLEKTLLENGTAAVIHNVKGYARIISCGECGKPLLCKICGNILVPASENTLICPVDSTAVTKPEKCPQCGSKKLRMKGPGIERIHKILASQYPGFPVSRFDAKTGLPPRKPGIIIGTQSLSAFIETLSPQLVIVLNADVFVSRSTFRAEEVFFLFIQKIRKKIPLSSKIIIQTYNPELHVFQSLQNNEPEHFYNYELSIREKLGFPPFSHMIDILFPLRMQEKQFASFCEDLGKTGKIYPEESWKQKRKKISWKVPEIENSLKYLQEIMEKHKLHQISVNPDSVI